MHHFYFWSSFGRYLIPLHLVYFWLVLHNWMVEQIALIDSIPQYILSFVKLEDFQVWVNVICPISNYVFTHLSNIFHKAHKFWVSHLSVISGLHAGICSSNAWKMHWNRAGVVNRRVSCILSNEAFPHSIRKTFVLSFGCLRGVLKVRVFVHVLEIRCFL